MNNNTTPVLLLTGYLGSGKTTLVNNILNNRRGIKFAVMVNDIGEVNIDADLIQKGGVVGQKDDSLVALQNGCICCTLKMDLVDQLNDIMRQQKFDYIVIEASGICEPGPIAQTICSMPNLLEPNMLAGIPSLDCIVTVVDAKRMADEFGCGEALTAQNIGEEDLESLVIQQIEFCNIILLNKASLVEPTELDRTKQIIRAIQPKAEIVECDFCNVNLDMLINTGMFDFEKVATSAAWIDEIENHHFDDDEDEDEHEHHHHHDHDEGDEHEHEHHQHHHDHEHEDEDEHEHHHHDHEHDEHCHHHHHHHHNHEHGEAEEYGIGTYVYYSRKPMNLGLFDDFVARKWPKNIIRTKGLCYFRTEYDVCYLFEQAGKQVTLNNAGLWYAAMPKDQLEIMLDQNPGLRRDWNEKYGDRMQKLVFIGQHLDKEAIKDALDACLDE